MTTTQEMAQTILGLSADDEATLQSWAELEDEAFQAYASSYLKPLRVCKGCHGG